MSVPIVLRTDAELNMGASWPASSSNAFRVITAEDDKIETFLNLVPEADLIFTCYAPPHSRGSNGRETLARHRQVWCWS